MELLYAYARQFDALRLWIVQCGQVGVHVKRGAAINASSRVQVTHHIAKNCSSIILICEHVLIYYVETDKPWTRSTTAS
jgi:hypothetical protein